MTIKQALQRFEWRFSNTWKPQELDLKAFNTIIDFVTEKHEQQFNSNQLFGKLFIIYYGELLRYYEETVFDDIPRKELLKALDKPIESIIKDFIDKHQEIEFALQFPKEIRYAHPRETAYTKVIEKLTEEEKDKMFKEVPKMEYEETVDNLKAMINYTLDKFNKL